MLQLRSRSSCGVRATVTAPLMAAIGIYLMGYYGIPRSEIYSIGQDRATANVLFKDAVAMCRAPIPGGDETDTLEERGEVVIRGELDNAWKIEHPETGSKFQSLANGEAISGPRPTAVLADEIHEFKNAGSIETWKRAIAKMPGDALMLLGTNTAFDRTMAFQAQLEKKIAALTPSQVNEALRRHVDLAKMSYVKAGDFKKAGVTP